MRFLVTGGPTHEFLDDVRFLGNPSTGAMGIAVAIAARDAGHPVTLVLGPTHLPDPEGVEVIRVVSAREMRNAVVAAWDGATVGVMTAAVSDYRPADRVEGKIKKGADRISLELVKNPDILAELGTMAAGRILVGFALEAGSPAAALAAARGKLTGKNADLIVLNRPGSFAGDMNEAVTLVKRDGEIDLGRIPKRALAEHIVRFCEPRGGHAAERGTGSPDGEHVVRPDRGDGSSPRS